MGATVLSRISLLRVRTRVQVITRLITLMRALAVRPWRHRILPVPWHCYGAPGQTCAMGLLTVVQSWITRPVLFLLRSAAMQGLQTTFMAGVELISRAPWARHHRRILRARHPVSCQWYS